MKRIFLQTMPFIAIVLSSFILGSCSNEENFSVDKNLQEINQNPEKTQKSILKEQFAFSLMQSIKESPRLRELIKNEALKMFKFLKEQTSCCFFCKKKGCGYV